MNSLTETTATPDTNLTTTPIETLSSNLIIAGLPSNSFTLAEFTQDTDDYVFITSTFDTDNNAFTLSRWVWLVEYDNRFLSTIHEGTSGYAVPVEDISSLTDRFQNITCEVNAAVQTYFADHNMDPRHITTTTHENYITTPEDENTVTVELTVPDTLPDETQTIIEDSWNEARNTDVFTEQDEYTLESTVAELRTLIGAYFSDIHEHCWEHQQSQSGWSL